MVVSGAVKAPFPLAFCCSLRGFCLQISHYAVGCSLPVYCRRILVHEFPRPFDVLVRSALLFSQFNVLRFQQRIRLQHFKRVIASVCRVDGFGRGAERIRFFQVRLQSAKVFQFG